MKMKSCTAVLTVLALITMSGCKMAKGIQFPKEPNWVNIAVIEDVEVFVDSASITHREAVAYAREKRVYITENSKQQYTRKIEEAYTRLGKPEKAEKWNDFNYCIYTCLYECTNKRFRILLIEDYDSNNMLIATTSPAESKTDWIGIEAETVGDYTFFYVCDHKQ